MRKDKNGPVSPLPGRVPPGPPSWSQAWGPELVRQVENFRLVGLTLTHGKGFGSSLLERGWTVFHSGITDGERRRAGVANLVAPRLSACTFTPVNEGSLPPPSGGGKDPDCCLCLGPKHHFNVSTLFDVLRGLERKNGEECPPSLRCSVAWPRGWTRSAQSSLRLWVLKGWRGWHDPATSPGHWGRCRWIGRPGWLGLVPFFRTRIDSQYMENSDLLWRPLKKGKAVSRRRRLTRNILTSSLLWLQQHNQMPDPYHDLTRP